jgi:hypothetical protein
MVPEKKYPFLEKLLSPFEKRHQKTMALVISAMAATGQARSMAIATTLGRWLKIGLGSALNRFYRLMRNTRVDYTDFVASWARLLARTKERALLIAVDWTEWHHDLRLLAAAVVTGRRAIPLFAEGFEKQVKRGSQNKRENTFLRLLAEAVHRAGCRATILCDRGFRRVSWIALLQQLQLSFVVRLKDDVQVEVYPGLRVALRDLLLKQGRVLDLGVIPLRADGKVQARVVGYFAPGAHEPWWLAASEECSATQVLKLYDRRMTVEEHFRDTKGKRFGVKLYWTQFRNPESIARFLMLLAVALLIWTLAGRKAALDNPSLRLPHPTKGPRQSYVTIGIRLLALEHVPISITPSLIARLLEAPTLRRIGKLHPGGK